MASPASKNGDVELNVVTSASMDNEDDVALVRLGKKAVLKVRIECHLLHEKMEQIMG